MARRFRSARGKLKLLCICTLIAIPTALLVHFLRLEKPFEAKTQPKTLSHEVSVSPPCKPVNNVLFLKTHKTGSTTLTSILNRYGDSRDLLFALPIQSRRYDFNWPRPFTVNFSLPLKRPPNFLCNHARYNKVPMNWLFPKKTTRYITILRESAEQFESVFNYYNHAKRYRNLNASAPLEGFFQNPEYYWNRKSGPLLRNPSLFDLGLDTMTSNLELTKVYEYIYFLQQEFDLVLLKEYFDESLVLLKRRFCWEIEDILYFKLNERTGKEKGSFTDDTREKIRKWNWGDVLLYDVFNQTLWEMIAQEGPEFYNDLASFRKEMRVMKITCLQEGDFLTKPYGRKVVQGYKIKENLSKNLTETCSKMIMNEIPYMNYLRQKMIQQRGDIDTAT